MNFCGGNYCCVVLKNGTEFYAFTDLVPRLPLSGTSCAGEESLVFFLT